MPSLDRLKNVRIVAHRGYKGNAFEKKNLENTLDSFRSAVQAGAWAIEFDIRWTADNVPIIHHDPNTRRVFKVDRDIKSLSFAECRTLFPLIPTLQEVVTEFGKKTHLFMEIKEPLLSSKSRVAIMADLVKDLKPIVDFHLISLRVEDLLACDFSPKESMIPVAEFNVREFSKLAIQYGMGGVSGQYLLVSNRILELHKKANQIVGTGFIASPSVFYREVNRGVDWIFTNYAAEVESWRKQAIQNRSS